MPKLPRFLTLFVFLAGSALAATEAPYFQVSGAPGRTDVLPLKSTAVHADIGLGFAEIQVVQTYVNNGTTELEATYLFPAGEGAAVHGLTMTIGDRRIEAVIKEKEEARKTYEAAKAAGKTAALLEARRPNVFSMKLARIRPGDTILVELRYTERVTPQGGEFTWAFPTTIGPRYESGGSGETVVGPTSSTQVKDPRFSLDVELRPGFPVAALNSPSHALRWVEQPDGATVSVADEGAPATNRDFILRYRLKGEATKPRLLVQDWQGQRYVAVNWMPPPRAQNAHALPREFVFVVDVSGSMGGFPLDTARTLIGELLQELREVDSFNIILFSGSNVVFSERPVAATPEAIARGLAFMNSTPGGGGTELLPALRQAMELPRAAGLARTLVVVTDGYVTVEAEAFALVTQKIGDAALFPFGIGMSVNRDLIARLARSGRTQSAVIEGPGRALEIAREFRRRIDSPVLTGTRLEWEGTGQLMPLPVAAPAYADQPWSFVARVEGPCQGKLRFSGMSDSGNFLAELPLDQAVHLPDGPLLAQSWARDQLERLSDLYALEANRVAIKQAIIALGLGYNLLTPFTSFVAVDTVARPTASPLNTAAQPNLLPAGMATAAMGEGVPSAPEPATWAMLALSGGALTSWWRRRRNAHTS